MYWCRPVTTGQGIRIINGMPQYFEKKWNEVWCCVCSSNQAKQERLWFGRDVFGRRSLLWHLPQGDDGLFVVSSVPIKPLVNHQTRLSQPRQAEQTPKQSMKQNTGKHPSNDRNDTKTNVQSMNKAKQKQTPKQWTKQNTPKTPKHEQTGKNKHLSNEETK